MDWTIEISQFPLSIPLVKGITSHATWVLKTNGEVVAALQGMAKVGYGFIKPMSGPFNFLHSTSDRIELVQ